MEELGDDFMFYDLEEDERVRDTKLSNIEFGYVDLVGRLDSISANKFKELEDKDDIYDMKDEMIIEYMYRDK